ncbi:hypothetical protein [Candidatus Parabeggiatoa sp. HSG14]|uniref:hypothetical protein n=1 Tax=Candidatus Parabeggiatoa sp. HSG14 TaxID=3055593 RepID=UPI0025A8B423|nr:hypothetical protein [Thiotrichales bacterium HSG14]
MRIQSHWSKRAKEKTLEDIASALGFISWKIALNGVLELENQGYQTENNAHRLRIVGEFLAFLLQVADRLAYEKFDEKERQRFITALALHVADTFSDNQHDVLGEGEHRKIFIDLLNQRAEDYAELSFPNDEAGFDFLRYFGEQVALILKDRHFVSQQIMDIEAPTAIKTLKKGMRDLFVNWSR